MKLKQSDTELDKLKKLLLGDELEKLAELESRLKELTFESTDKEAIRTKILPLFDTLLLERLRSADQKTIEILSDHLAAIISEASRKHTESISRSLQSILAEAVKKEIASNKDAMIDSLYPIMGGMISKYVTSAIRELMETINQKIDEGLSFDRLKRKIKSKVTGVSETELLLEESGEARISSLFVIHKKSSLLISEAHSQENRIDDPHMIASMASAIKDFINDWIQSSEAHEEIQLLSYGNATLYIESAGTVYLIAFMDAEPDQEQRQEINRFFATLVKKYGSFFQRFDGDDSSKEVASLSRELQHYLDSQKILSSSNDAPKSNYAKYLLAAILIGLSIPLYYWAADRYLEYRIESEITEQTGGYPIDITVDKEKITAQGSVDTFIHLNVIDSIIRKNSDKKLINHITIPMIRVEKLYNEQKTRLQKNISGLKERIDMLERELRDANDTLHSLGEALQASKAEAYRKQRLLEEEKRALLAQKKREREAAALREQKIGNLANLKKNIDKALRSTLDRNPYFNPKNSALVFSSNQFFPKGENALNKKAKETIAKVSETYIKTLLGITGTQKYLKALIVSGHTDSDGTLQYNTQLSKQRAQFVSDVLSKMRIVKQNNLLPLLKTVGYADRYKIMRNGVEDKNASRRTKIQFELDDRRITEDIQKLINERKK